MENRNNQTLMDALAIVSFMIGLANYGENVNQGQMQEVVNQAVQNIHQHLEIQDHKIDEILSLLKGGNLP